jgi:3-hydroxyacyl-CoA dehydrogenase/3a,7a,12a-trihydroxy-5b-cholest-24-enoyl-CoA hydratase
MAELRFDGKVALVTGAGRGLGRAYALMFAAHGARVVVNDLGGDLHGGGRSASAADDVVAEIAAAGGEAVASHASVEDGARIVQEAVGRFGTLDIVVNNAGVLRDVTFHKMTQQDWDVVQRVHLEGSFRVTHAAWPILREKKYGRVIFTTSIAGLYGNFGQANYASAKMGLVGLAQTLALEGGPRGIHVNVVAPLAGSRLTETVLPPDVVAALKPEFVSPLVGWLCHASCAVNGGIFEVGAGRIQQLRWERSRGYHLRNAGLEELAADWPAVGDFRQSEHPAGVNATLEAVIANLRRG